MATKLPWGSRNFQFWIGTVVGGAVVVLAGGILARVTDLSLIAAQKLMESASIAAANIIANPAKSLEEAHARAETMKRFQERVVGIDFGSIINSAALLAEQEKGAFQEKKLREEKEKTVQEKLQQEQKNKDEEEARKKAAAKEAAAAEAALAETRRREQERIAALAAERERAERQLAIERAQAERFDRMLQSSRAR